MSNQDLTKNNKGSNQGDLISREALLKAIKKLPNDNPSYYFTGDLLDREKVLDEIDNAPTVERPHGKWIYTDKEDKKKGYGGYCSVCKCDMPIGINDWKQEYYESNFCPNCGAYMRGE